MVYLSISEGVGAICCSGGVLAHLHMNIEAGTISYPMINDDNTIR
jgi:hypothetical protein